MNSVAIRVEGLGKQYRIGSKQPRYNTLQDTLVNALSSPFRRARNLIGGQAYGAAGLEETIWALKDVSFEVKHGEVVGIIGRNGAGKSTLLKILSRITKPTEGYADIYGRIGSLLEVGTGFHPELTGRENIYLNGAILGMSHAQINRKFDEIVDFSGVEQFIDTPVKYYSSGMRLRLGFSVAAYLEPDILVVDEVLAVGDAAFQKKCLGKMSDVARGGRTVLFVSHNMVAMSNLTQRCLLLDQGSCVNMGETADIIAQYTERNLSAQPENLINQDDSAKVKLIDSKVITSSPNNIHDHREKLIFQFTVCVTSPIRNARMGLTIDDALRRPTVYAWNFGGTGFSMDLDTGIHTLTCTFPALRLYQGHYSITLHLSEDIGAKKLLKIENAATFSVSMMNASGQSSMAWSNGLCAYIDDFEWSHSTQDM